MGAAAEVTATIATGNGTNVEVTWPAGTCAARGTRIMCRTADRSATAAFRQGSGGSWSYKVSVTGLTIAGPPVPPVSLHLYYGGDDIDHIGNLSACTASPTMLRCKAH